MDHEALRFRHLSMRGSRKYHIPFEDKRMLFSERYPDGLLQHVSLAEIDAVVRRLNSEIVETVLPIERKMRLWIASTVFLSFVGIGLLGVPVCVGVIYQYKREMRQYWARVRSFFALLNRRIYTGQRIEWRLVEDHRKMDRRDVVNPLLGYAVEVSWKPLLAAPENPAVKPMLPKNVVQPMPDNKPSHSPLLVSESVPHRRSVRDRDRALETVALIENLATVMHFSKNGSPASLSSFETVEVHYSPREEN